MQNTHHLLFCFFDAPSQVFASLIKQSPRDDKHYTLNKWKINNNDLNLLNAKL